MKLYIYRSLENEEVPKDITHVIVDSNVTVIMKRDFQCCELLVYVIMGDNVKRIEEWAFRRCVALRFIRLSNTLDYIGEGAFYCCDSLEPLFLPSTVKSIERWAFEECQSLRLPILRNDIDLDNVEAIVNGTAIHHIAGNAGVAYAYNIYPVTGFVITEESILRVNEWLIHQTDEAPFHKLCYNSSIATKQLINYINDHGNESALAIDSIHGMTPLQMLSMNPHSPADAIAALLNISVEVAFRFVSFGFIRSDPSLLHNLNLN